MDALGALAALGDRYSLDAIYAFGSLAKDAARFVAGDAALDTCSASDIDLAVLPATGRRLSIDDILRAGIELEEIFQGARVDLVVLPTPKPYLALDIVRGELLWVGDRDHEAEYQLHVLRRAGDLARFERERRRLVFAGGRG